MKHLIALLFAGLLTLGASAAAQAAQINMAKITCQDVIAMPAGATLVVAGWMSGYFNAKANNTVVDLDIMMANGQVVSDFCSANPTMSAMKAIEALMPK